MNAVSGNTFYDLPGVSEEYLLRRERSEHPNDLMEQPYVRELVGKVTGRSFVDLGCGDARYGNTLLDEGADSYLGIDGSRKLLEQARLTSDRMRVQHTDIARWRPDTDTADVVTARMVRARSGEHTAPRTQRSPARRHVRLLPRAPHRHQLLRLRRQLRLPARMAGAGLLPARFTEGRLDGRQRDQAPPEHPRSTSLPRRPRDCVSPRSGRVARRRATRPGRSCGSGSTCPCI
ncbi:class I SAM-dependent methyltransferase [Streptomyces sp. NPDC005794]|uniref:class I SAM-dependent methyltransferase n=1 Tax=Streptomyces sp. NPDC005794 TaxID=3364733 RepID=UPI00369F1A3D